ncbi:MAG: peptidoglycan-binding protein [Acidobacteria bacterium]|nr:peptidoglycan-binding protein [Acidobacteriota bacterium]
MQVLRSVIVLAVALFVCGDGVCRAAEAKKQPARKGAPAVKSQSKARPKSAAVAKAPSKGAAKAPSKVVAKASSKGVAKAPARTAAHKGAASRAKSTHVVAKKAPVRRGPMYPSQDRYREIQQALADKGYYQGSVNGAWGPESTDALKRFQKDQNLSDSGRLDSLSIIALGLGPKRNLSSRSSTESRPKDDNRRPEGSERP